MRVIKSDTGFLYYEKIFKQLSNDQAEVVLWQISSSGKRSVLHSKLNSFRLDSRKLFFELPESNQINASLPVFCYAQNAAMIFKSEIQEILGSNVSVEMPSELKILEEPEVVVIKGMTGVDLSDAWKVKRLQTNYSNNLGHDVMRVKSMAERSSRDQELLQNEFALSVDEEDKIYADKRESPRARPKDDKWVKIAQLQGNGPETYKLFDLSQGGLGFVNFDETEFTKGTEVHILGFNDLDLDDPLIGKVMSIRPIDAAVPGEASSEFKIGIKFSDGQD